MLNRKKHKRYACFLHYFLFYATIIAYCSLTSCFGARTVLIPKINQTFVKLSEQAQEEYCKLMELLNDDEKKELDQTARHMKNPADLEKFIQAMLLIKANYQNTEKLLSKPEQEKLQQQWKKSYSIKDITDKIKYKEKLIAQYGGALKLIKDAPMLTQQHYIDLLKVLPEAESVALKNDIVHAGSLDKIEELIASKLPEAFKQLNDTSKNNYSMLSDKERQDMLRKLLNQSGKTALLPSYEEAMGITPPSYEKATPSDIEQLIQQKLEEQKEKDDTIPEDKWCGKLLLTDANMKDFQSITISLGPEDETILQKFVYEADEDSMEYISFILYKSFNKTQRTNLLRTIIYLYKEHKDILLTMCNYPENLNWGQKFTLLKETDPWQLTILQYLNKCLERFKQCNYDEELYEKKYCH